MANAPKEERDKDERDDIEKGDDAHQPLVPFKDTGIQQADDQTCHHQDRRTDQTGAKISPSTSLCFPRHRRLPFHFRVRLGLWGKAIP